MNDLDLDELDQAVSAMMDGRKRKKSAPPSKPVVQEDAVSVVRTGQTPMRSPQPRPVASRPVSVTRPDVRPGASTDFVRPVVNRSDASSADPALASRAQTTPQITARKRTRPVTMDIVQPSTPKVAPPSARPARVASAIQPTQPVTPDPIKQEPEVPQDDSQNMFTRAVPAADVPAFSASKPVQDEVSDDLLASLALNDQPTHASPSPTLLSDDSDRRHGWPDPLDFHDFDDGHKDDSTADDKQLPVSDDQDAPTMSAKDDSDDDLNGQDAAAASSTTPFTPSPFLTTKVEKRPLGAYADATSQLSQAETDYLAQQNEPAPAEPIADSAPDDSTLASQPQFTSQQPQAVLSSQPAQSDQTAATQSYQPPRPTQQFGNQDTSSLDELRHMSIPQQYHAPQRESNDDVRNLFDIKEYHAAPHPIHSGKQHSPWLTVTVVVLSVLAIVVALVAYLMMIGFDFGGI